MNNIQRLPVNPANVVAVLLADGWHYVVPGSFTIGPLGFGVDEYRLGYRFDEDDGDSAAADQPTSLTGALDTLLAVRQSRVRRPVTDTIEPARPLRRTVPAAQHPSRRGFN